MIVDAHCHLSAELPATELVRVMDEGGVDKAVLLAELLEPGETVTAPRPRRPFPGLTQSGGVGVYSGRAAREPDLGSLVSTRTLLSPLHFLERTRYAGAVQDGCLNLGPSRLRIRHEPDNGPVEEALRAYPDRFLAFVTVNPQDPSSTDVVGRYLAKGFSGVKVHAWYHGVDLVRQLYRSARLCGRAGRPVLLHLGGTYRTGLAVIELANRLPATNFILAHAGLPYYHDLWQAARTHPNLYFDLAGPYMSAELVLHIASRVPPGRLLFASGGPVGLRRADGGHSYSKVRYWIDLLQLGGEARKAVLGENLLRLIGQPLPKRRPAFAFETRGGRDSSSPGR